MAKAKAVEISHVNIRIGKKEIALSVEEAKELRDILNDVLGQNERPIYIASPYPVYVEPWPYKWWQTSDTGTITFCNTSATITDGASPVETDTAIVPSVFNSA